MKYKIENLEEITDAKDIMNAYLNSCSYKLLKYILYIVMSFLICIMVWSIFAKKTIVISAHGELHPKDNICNIYIKNTSLGTIKEGDRVQLETIPFSKNEYGVITSKLENISDDIVIDEKSGEKYYTADCKLDTNILVDKRGNNVNIRNGMEANVSIVTYETSYFKYILKKLIQ
ncbi:hypothetical protein [Clostridium saccharobutylicum]|uniref:AprE-like beta-barrel domain-containing protein n=1 Tax=Clostridium saccharobutylicum DSM 13864 TaxID=1345695 RepID=U5MKX9_CLOSA|nr:hypothetical protein [Clostridium saccharobutylicum]AGX41188.1 hypothetical protein CLSA_c01150 [Clostridium saccharobutylicum DSM 13864]AQR88474.1 hypothetical protein CLOSC_01150 [Clostridium saccharobutylicum]AQR98372.1 hypothetical protein CSACC_01150 [Clostridium saccharobutylicum]AQS08083.1 hypothetical protein CLOBY_01320 [Clostridium saccharobutylicum]AQS12362.1 hypothetical protein CLOSACC_01150 [Clostridium saccharobutylicum]